jgi:hypothetical protein
MQKMTITIPLLFAAALITAPAFAQNGDDHWVGTWGASLHEPDLGAPGLSNAGFNNQTLRQIVHASVGGSKVRVRLSTFGAPALVVGAAHIARRDAGAAIVTGSDRTLTFGGSSTVTIPSGAPVLSDPVDLSVPDLTDVAISIFVPGKRRPLPGTSRHGKRSISRLQEISRLRQ